MILFLLDFLDIQAANNEEEQMFAVQNYFTRDNPQ